MAEALLQELRPYLMEAKTVQQDVTFGVHSPPPDKETKLPWGSNPWLTKPNRVVGVRRAGGHSLGGAFALMVACAARLRLQLPSSSIECYAFGSPPVLARADKADARDVLQVLRPGWLNSVSDQRAWRLP